MTIDPSAIRLLVSDIDGTLVDHEKRLSDATAAAVTRLRAAGVGFAMISARPRSGMIPIAAALGVDEPIAAFNGGTVFRPDGAILERHTVPRSIAEQVASAAHDANATLWIFAEDRWYATALGTEHDASERRASFQEPVRVSGLSDVSGDIDKLTIVSDDAPLLARLTDTLGAALAGRANVIRSQSYYLDVTAAEADKGGGVAALARLAGLPLSSVAVIGDMHNDVAMFARAGLAIAMGQAPDAVRAAADWVTDANDRDGVAAAIDRLLGTPSAANQKA